MSCCHADFALIESSLGLRLELEDAVHPSQRNVASLYEYWTFLKLAAVLGEKTTASICAEVVGAGSMILAETTAENRHGAPAEG